MARELIKANLGINYNNDSAHGATYTDVNIDDINSEWIGKLQNLGFTADCDTDKFCPDAIVTRGEMAKIFLFTKLGIFAVPQPEVLLYTDVPITSLNAGYIHLLAENINYTEGCAANRFCPNEPVTREWFDSLLAQLP